LKNQGNEQFKTQQFKEAKASYKKAVDWIDEESGVP
jgi:hypothetical protein